MVDPHEDRPKDADGADDPATDDPATDDPATDDPVTDDADAEDTGPRDAFDDIVRGLDMDWTEKDWADPGVIAFGTPESQRPPELEPDPDLDAEPDPVDEQFYRRVGNGPVRPIHRGRLLAWAGVLGTPAVLAICLLAGIWISRPVLLTAGLTVVAGSIYLISQLPERGPSHPDWPDDGAVL